MNVRGVVNFTYNAVGPFGQLDVNITSGSPIYRIFRGSTLLYSGFSSSVTVNFGCNGGTLRVEANTACGTASKTVIIPSGCSSFIGQSSMVVFPNPTTGDVNIAQKEEFKKVRTDNSLGATRLELYDFNGNMIKSQEYSNFNGEIKIDMSDLTKETYLLRIVAKEVDEVHQIIVK